MNYYFNEIDPYTFQRLTNAILVARLGEDTRVTPLLGPDGGRDTETAEGNPYIQFEIQDTEPPRPSMEAPIRPGRYLFQSKFHRTLDSGLSAARSKVLSDFSRELRTKVLPLASQNRITYFFLITNVPGSRDALAKLDRLRSELLQNALLHADVWWQEQLTAQLDLLPSLWNSFPMLFAGGKPPLLSDVVAGSSGALPRAIRISIRNQYTRDRVVRFRQIDLAKDLANLFVDLDIDPNRSLLPLSYHREIWPGQPGELWPGQSARFYLLDEIDPETPRRITSRTSALRFLLHEAPNFPRRILLEGGPGQGKSTITQMLAQIYRDQLLGEFKLEPEGRWRRPTRYRLPVRIELRQFAEQLARNPALSIEQYAAAIMSSDTGGATIDVDQLHDVAENSPILLIFDGLDEVGKDELRDLVLERINETVSRLEQDLKADLKIVLTSRPPAIAGRQIHLTDFARLPLSAMNSNRVDEYLARWLKVQLHDEHERSRVRSSFEARRAEPHVDALSKNPMQLSVLLHFAYLKGEAFPSRRSDLYLEYFKIVIDRDVEKSPELRVDRDIVESLHRFLGFRIHALTEAQKADGSLTRKDLLHEVGEWLRQRGDDPSKAGQLFKLGEERLGLVVILRGEGAETRYGFEIQPIREYFAASHISEYMSVNAHELFERMVRRPYWREVALFLGGLRRENEKADLVSRARQLDNDPQLGWRQDGRDIILQLCREGALSQPRHVLSDSLHFLIDLLDPELVPAPNEPREFLPTLSRLLSTEGLTDHSTRLRSLVERYKHCNDRPTIKRVYLAAASVLDENETIGHILSFSSDAPEIVSEIRLRVPYEAGLRSGAPTNSSLFWEGAPDPTWAKEWWITANTFPQAANIQAPEKLHPYLIERFAFEGTSNTEITGNLRITIPTDGASSSNWAAWTLFNLSNILTISQYLPAAMRHETPELMASLNSTVDFCGLDKKLISTIEQLISAARKLTYSLFQEGDTNEDAFRSFFSALRKILQKPGLEGLLAARLLWPFLLPRHRLYYYATRPSLPLGEGAAETLKEVLGFWSIKNTEPHPHLFEEYRDPNLLSLPPYAFRPSANAGLAPIAQHAAELIARKQFTRDWTTRAPLTAREVVTHLGKLNRIEPLTLARLNQLELRNEIRNRPLQTAHLQKIVGIARKTEEPAVLSGCALAISGSKFLRLCGAQLVLKLLASSPGGHALASTLFGGRSRATETEENLNLVGELALRVLEEPKSFPLPVVLAAVTFRAGHSPNNLPPLTSTADI